MVSSGLFAVLSKPPSLSFCSLFLADVVVLLSHFIGSLFCPKSCRAFCSWVLGYTTHKPLICHTQTHTHTLRSKLHGPDVHAPVKAAIIVHFLHRKHNYANALIWIYFYFYFEITAGNLCVIFKKKTVNLVIFFKQLYKLNCFSW